MSAVRKRMDFEFKKLLDGRNIDVDMEEAKERRSCSRISLIS
jgi:hypothetical protein